MNREDFEKLLKNKKTIVREKKFGVAMNKEMKREENFYVYILQCKGKTYYTGYTNNLEARVDLHNKGQGAKYLRGKLPVKLVFAKEYRYYKNALRAERNLKKLTRAQKEELVRIYESNKCGK